MWGQSGDPRLPWKGRDLEKTVIVAFSDVHAPRYLPLLSKALQGYQGPDPCIVVMAGDLVDKGKYLMMNPLLKLVKSRFPGAKLVAVFGNEEYESVRGALRRSYNEVDWLDDEFRVYECGDLRVAIVGTQGALEKPTKWQARNMPHLFKVYRERPRAIASLISHAKRESDIVVLASHYALSRETVKGEDPRVWPYLYSGLMERVVAEAKPHIAIHGHAHKGSPFAIVSGVPVFNVALPLNKRIVRVFPPQDFKLL
ncbi:MAG: metallophosphoesterase [Desulfurococcales archaeon]|nr:metallophosphoesterase [Desulfurococcales archaeon]